jgi:hypothetical protein
MHMGCMVSNVRLLLSGVFLLCLSQEARPQSISHSLGSNLTEVTDYSPQIPFNNLFLTSREWLTQCRTGIDPGCTNGNSFDTGESNSLDLDSAGWVRSLPAAAAAPIYTRVATVWDLSPEFPKGKYVVLYQGAGTIEYELGARKVDELSTQQGRDVIEIDPSRGVALLRIAITDPGGSGDYIRNIRVVALDNEAALETQRFSATFLKQLRPYQALRFMDWMRTNNSTLSNWASRATPSDARYSTGKGVPAEVMIELANTTQAAPWFTIPHQADDAFVEQFAQLCKQNLSPQLSVYVEYSNEVWNSAFEQGAFLENRGQQEWPASSESGFTKRINYYGKRSAEVCQIWKQAFGTEASRVVCIIASQAANSWTADEALRCPLWAQGPCVSHGVSALAIAPYFGDYLGQEDDAGQVASWGSSVQAGLTTLFREVTSGSQLNGGPQGGALEQSFQWIEANRSVANTHSVDLVSYEGGQHLVGVGSARENTTLTSLFTAANRDQRMKDAYQRYLSGWSSRGGGLFMHYADISSYSKYGSWGALETIGQTSSPKYEALREYSPIKFPNDPDSAGTTVTLTVIRSEAGIVRSRRAGIECGSACSAAIEKGSRITLTARPRRGFIVRRWRGACVSRGSRCTTTMSRDRAIRAIFRRK